MSRHFWTGMEIRPSSRVTAFKTVKIDRAAVRVYRTLLGKVYYQVEGTKYGGIEWWPIGDAMDAPAAALEACDKLRAEIDRAREHDRKKEEQWRMLRGEKESGAIGG